MQRDGMMPAKEQRLESATLVDYVKSLDCIHCGLCLRTCPTYRLSGAEASSPRGRIHLMRALAEGELAADAGFAEEMEFCLLCRHCESVCPSGVRFGSMMETTRAGLAARGGSSLRERALRWIGFRALLPRRWVLRAAISSLRLAQRSGMLALAAKLFGERGKALLAFPAVPPGRERALLPETSPPRGERAGAVALLEGCVMPELLPGVNRASAAVLTAAGYEVRTARAAVCCGSLHAHNGDLEGARALARRLVVACEAQAAALPLVTNSAGCGAHLKELHHLFPPDDPWHARAHALARRVHDYSEVVAPLLAARAAELETPPLPQPVTWDDPCHLCHGQGVRAQPRAVLAALPGLARVELPDSEACCGSAGIYSLLRPADSRAVFAKKLADLERSGARTLVTANPGCQMQWESGLARARSEVRVVHLAEAVDAALSG